MFEGTLCAVELYSGDEPVVNNMARRVVNDNILLVDAKSGEVVDDADEGTLYFCHN